MADSSSRSPRRYAVFVHANRIRVGDVDFEKQTIQPLSLISGTPLTSIYQAIEAGEDKIVGTDDLIELSAVKILPPLPGRDVLAVGKNYMEHAKEFNKSGYDSSDTVDKPSHPVIFTKRATSIIADGEDIFLHPEFTKTADYEGEIGVIVGKAGFRIKEEDAWDHVWGYTIINDVTARERQRDHKQFFIGKSPDTFCPMGPVAVPKEYLPSALEVQTHVNGELRQRATTDELIFSIPYLLKTISEGQTLQPGDVIATGTPFGVGFGLSPPTFLKPGDKVVVTVTGLGSLTNTVGDPVEPQNTARAAGFPPALTTSNTARSLDAGLGLTVIDGKPLYYRRIGEGPHHIIFAHGLGANSEFWSPLVQALSLSREEYSLHLFDFEGHGLSPTHPLSTLSIKSFASDIHGVLRHVGVSASKPASIVAHSMSSLSAIHFALDHPELVGKLVLLGPAPSPLPEAVSKAIYARAALVRAKGMTAIVDTVVNATTSEHTRATSPLATTAVRLSLLGQDPEGYAKACWALAKDTESLQVEKLTAKTLIVAGGADPVSPLDVGQVYVDRIRGSRLEVIKDCGHWHTFENPQGLAELIGPFVQED